MDLETLGFFVYMEEQEQRKQEEKERGAAALSDLELDDDLEI